MPASERSLRITDTYRNRLQTLRARAVLIAKGAWQQNLDPAALDRSHEAWVATTATAVAELQRGGARLSHAFLSAYLTSELGRRVEAADVDTDAHVGLSRDGRPLSEALAPSLFTVKAAIGDGRPLGEALGMGLNRAARLVGEEAINPSRQTLSEGIREDDRIIGWRRVTSGGCGACLAAATGAIQPDDEALEVHDNCQCSTEPVVRDAPDRVLRPSGHELFEGMTVQEQDQLLGQEKAGLVRSGGVALHDLIQREHFAVLPTGITEAPLQALQQQ